MTDFSRPAPGWYADPHGDGRLRYWDGRGWTDDIRDGDATPPPSPSPARDAPARNKRLVLIAAAAVVVLVGMIALLSGHRTSHKLVAPPPRPVPDACTVPEPRPSAGDVLAWFERGHVPATPLTQVHAPVPQQGCSAVAFRDTRVSKATNFIYAMSSPATANAMVQELGSTSFADYVYVVQLDTRLAPERAAYQSALTGYLRIVDPGAQSNAGHSSAPTP